MAQCTDESALDKILNSRPVTFYIGFDPTADSLHAGHFIALMAMAWMQRAGHKPICLVGGGTGTIGDPSGRTDMRKFLTDEIIEHNCEQFKKQIARFIDFSEDRALMVNNGDWLRKLNYIDLLRDIGPHFTVNRMLAAECYKNRWEKGLTFLEFNYMVMQAFDFYTLNSKYNCELQMGGDDQWSNIIAGVELIRRKTSKTVFGLTNKLLTKSDGQKMGKTAGGALWLDADKTSPYDFYQYWRNIDDADVKKCLSLLTFLPMEEVEELSNRKDSSINDSKKILAFEVTKLVHGEEEARKAETAATNLFTGNLDANMPTIKIENLVGRKLLDVLVDAKIFSSKSEARRMIQQNGLTLNDQKISDEEKVIDENDLPLIIRKGKKKFWRIES